MTPFLQQVAEVYATKEPDSLSDCCFVFPNKRSASFFAHFLQQAIGDKPVFMPAITNISEFVASLSDRQEASRYDQLFTLFDEYRKIPGVEVEFDQFLFWGEMLLSDFNDVDRYLVDPDALFINVKRLREISSNFLTEEQIDVIRRFWGEDRTRETVDRFWKHIDQEGNKPQQQKFILLWEVLQPLYHAYRRRLASEGLATSGMLYRDAVDALSPASDTALPYQKYIFVGFNVLSTAEIKIFQSLQRREMADFYWDYNSPALRMKDSRAARFITRNIKEFPSHYSLPEPEIEALPEINILGIPSNIGQVKAAGNVIRRWVEENKISDATNAIDTAVVLPDESLFVPMIHSIPDCIEKINVTMGYPMKLSPMATLLRNIVSLQLRSRLRAGDRVYFYEDVNTLLTSSAIRSIDREGCDRLEEIVRKNRLFTIPSQTIIETIPALLPIFTPISDNANVESVHAYISSLCDFLSHTIAADDKIQLRFVESYREATDNLFEAARRFKISMADTSFFKLIERAIASDTVRFVGEPLCGLQVMGVLETRALDFKNIIMLSMNERIFPRRHYTRSFIPDALRHGYGMATTDFQESIFAYYFYRLIARAENVTLIYDARTVGGNRSNEMSRYLAQLLYFYGGNDNYRITHHQKIYNAQRFSPSPISITKNDHVKSLLNEFKAGGSKILSASALNTYINCPLNFYLQYVEGFNADNELTDYIDSSTYGSIVHDVAQKIYESIQDESHSPVTITESMLSPLTRTEDITLDRLITRSINEKFNRFKQERLDEPLLGESLVLGKVIRAALTAMLRADIARCPFTFIAAEKEITGVLEINPGLTINVKQIIDRIDKTGDMMRFVDYKTGLDTLSSPSVDQLFNGEAPNRAKAIMQLLMYCHIYNTLQHSDHPIEPIIYKFLAIPGKGVEKLKINRQEIGDYHSVRDEFVELLYNKIEEIFDENKKFEQTNNEHNCTFCQFKSLCGKE